MNAKYMYETEANCVYVKQKKNKKNIRRKSHTTATSKKVTNSLFKCIRFDFVSFKTVKLNCEGEIRRKKY